MEVKKRICMVVQEYFPEDPRVRKYVETLTKNGYMVDIISLKRPDLKFKDRYHNSTIYRIGIPKMRGTILRYIMEYLIFFMSSFFLLNLLFLKNWYRVIHVHNMPDFLVFVAILPKILGAKIILDMHEPMPEFFQIKFGVSQNSIPIWVCRFTEYLSLHFAYYVITVTDRIKERFIKRDNIKNIKVIMNTNYYISDNKLKPTNAEYFEMIYHGTLTDLYSLDLPIKALSLVEKEAKTKLRFNIYGEGPSRERLEKLVEKLELQNTVIFHGKVPHKEILKVLKKVDLGILAFRRSQYMDLSFSNKLSEYVNNCVPVLTTKLPSVLDYFDESDLFLCEDNVESVQKKLLEILEGDFDIEKKTLLAKKNYKKISWETMEQRYLSIINHLKE